MFCQLPDVTQHLVLLLGRHLGPECVYLRGDKRQSRMWLAASPDVGQLMDNVLKKRRVVRLGELSNSKAVKLVFTLL